MSNQSRSEEYLKQNNVTGTKLISSSQKCKDQSKNTETPSSSALEVISKKENESISGQQSIQKGPDLSSSDQVEEHQSKILINDTLNQMEAIQAEILINEKLETTKQKTFKLPTDSEANGHSSEHEIVGDDFSKKNEIHIVCECEPNVAGAAVPTVTSFILTENQNSITRCNHSNCNMSQNDLKHTDNCHKSLPLPAVLVPQNKEIIQNISKIEQKQKENEKEKFSSSNVNRKFKFGQQPAQCFKLPVEKSSSEVKGYQKKPSLIPKLTRPTSSSSGRSYECTKDEPEKREIVSHSRIKLDPVKHFTKSTSNDVNIKDTKATRLFKSNKINNNVSRTIENHSQNSGAQPNTITISSRMLGLQERLKATTSMLRQKIEMDKSKEKVLPVESSVDLSVQEQIKEDISAPTKKIMEDLYKSISCLKDTASALSENNALKSKKKYIEKLFKNISEIKLIADKLYMQEPSKSRQNILDDSNGNILLEKEKSQKYSAANTKDNKIYIKFMHAKDRKSENKKKKRELSPEQSEEVQTDLALGSKLTSDSLNSDSGDVEKVEKNQEENKIKEADSMDGVFIPSCEPPKNMEDDEETNGLDITITFPEFSQLYSDGQESHLSVCLSDISAEALKKLKRCPKDFTLRMDFVEGKILFQSGKGPANNFQIGPDLKFAENIVDTKKSDVISIKPSTECSFGSQLIPVENPKEIKSFKSLKSTDSELFNVVSLPFLYKNSYLATSHKSCITFRNDRMVSMAIIAKHIFKSMPQIPSLTNIFEDKIMESSSKTALQIQEKRRRNRQNQRKWTSASSVL